MWQYNGISSLPSDKYTEEVDVLELAIPFIDLDECGVFVETADKHIGKAYVGNRVRQEGNYQKSEKWTLLLAVAGSAAAERLQMMWLEGGTTGDKMIEFIELILNAIGPGTPARRRCFTMDNLS